jgi:cytoskeletal protein RodZ
MDKKNKQNSKKHATKSVQTTPKPKKRSKYPLIALAVGVALLISGVYFFYQKGKSQNPSLENAKLKKENVDLREKRSTLSPQSFTGKIRRAYEVARSIPEVLDRLYCYCRCRENHGHKNLLSCYVDTHAYT